jgi:hypothetical protein
VLKKMMDSWIPHIKNTRKPLYMDHPGFSLRASQRFDGMSHPSFEFEAEGWHLSELEIFLTFLGG